MSIGRATIPPLHVFQKLLKETPGDWERCLRAVHGCTMAGVVGWQDLPLDPIMAVLRANPEASWQPAMQLLSMMQARSQHHQGAPLPLNSAVIKHGSLFLDALRLSLASRRSTDTFSAPVDMWVAALMLQASSRECKVPIPEATMRLTILPQLEAELAAMNTPHHGERSPLHMKEKREVLTTAVQLERVDLMYRRLQNEAVSSYALVDDESPPAAPPLLVGGGLDDVTPPATEDAVLQDLMVKTSTAAKTRAPIRSDFEGLRDALCNAIAVHNDLDAIVALVGRTCPSLFSDWKIVEALMSVASFHNTSSAPAVIDAATWGTALRLLRYPLFDMTAPEPTAATIHPTTELQQHVCKRVLASSYITTHVFCAELRPEVEEIFQRQVQEIRRCCADLTLLVHHLVHRLRTSETSDDKWAQMDDSAMTALQDVSSPACREHLSTLVTPTSQVVLVVDVEPQINPSANLLRDCMTCVRSVIRALLRCSDDEVLYSWSRLLLNCAWILESSRAHLQAYLSTLEEAQTHEKLKYLLDNLSGEVINIALRLHVRIGSRPAPTEEAPTPMMPASSGRRRRGPDARSTAIARSSQAGRLQEPQHAEELPRTLHSSTDKWMTTAVELVAMHMPHSARGQSSKMVEGRDALICPAVLQQGMNALAASLRESKGELRFAKATLRAMLVAATPPPAALAASTTHTDMSSLTRQRLRCVLERHCDNIRSESMTPMNVGQLLIRRVAWLVSNDGTLEAKAKTIALRCVSEVVPDGGTSTTTMRNEQIVTDAFIGFARIALCGLQTSLAQFNAVTVSKNEASVIVSAVVSLTGLVLSDKWFRLDRVMEFVQLARPALAYEESRVVLAITTSPPTTPPTSCARNIVNFLLARGSSLSQPKWHEALQVVEMVSPDVRESVTTDLLQKDEQARLVALALRGSEVLSKKAERKIRKALDERLRVDILEELNRLRRTHQWKDAISIFQEYGLQMLRSGCGYAFAFAAGRHPPFAEILGGHMEALGGTCSSVGTAALTAAVRLWRDRGREQQSDGGHGAGTIDAGQRVPFDRDTTNAIYRHRAKMCASMALRILPHPIQGNLLSTITARVIELMEGDEVAAVEFLQHHGVLDESALKDARDTLERSLNLGMSVKEPFHQFRKTFPGCQPSREAFFAVFDRLLDDLLDDDKAASALCAQSKLTQNSEHQWVPPIQCIASTSVSNPKALTVANLVADASLWGWSGCLLDRMTRRLATTSGNSRVGYNLLTILWCRMLANQETVKTSSLVPKLPSILTALFAVKVSQSIAPHALIANPLEAYGNKWSSVEEMVPHLSAYYVTDLLKTRLRPLWGFVSSPSPNMVRDNHSAWLTSRQPWIEWFLPLSSGLLVDYHASTLASLKVSWSVESLASLLRMDDATKSNGDARNALDVHVAQLDLWVVCFTHDVEALVSCGRMSITSVSVLGQGLHRLCSRLRQLVQFLEDQVRENATVHPDFCLSVVVTAWLPIVMRSMALLWFHIERWQLKCSGGSTAAAVVDATMCKLLNRMELLDVLQNISDARWEMTNATREFATILKISTTHAASARSGGKSRESSSLALRPDVLNKLMTSARDGSLQLFALCARHVRNPQQLELARKATDASLFAAHSFVQTPSSTKSPTEAIMSVSLCTILMSSGNDPAADTVEYTTVGDSDAIVLLQRVLQHCKQWRSAHNDDNGTGALGMADSLKPSLRQAVAALESFTIHCRGQEDQRLSSSDVDAVVAVVAEFLSDTSANSSDHVRSVEDVVRAKESLLSTARWLVFRTTNLESFYDAQNAMIALCEHLPSLELAERTIRESFNVHHSVEEDRRLLPTRASSKAFSIAALDLGDHLGKFQLMEVLDASAAASTAFAGYISDMLVAKVLQSQRRADASRSSVVVPEKAETAVVLLLDALSRWCVHRWDLAVEIILSWFGLPAQDGSDDPQLYWRAWHQRVEHALTSFTNWPPSVALRLFLGIERMVPIGQHADQRLAMLLAVDHPPPTEFVQLAQHEVLSITSGLKLITNIADDDAAGLCQKESQTLAIAQSRMSADATPAKVMDALRFPSVMLLKNLTPILPSVVPAFCSSLTSEELPPETCLAVHWMLHTRLPLQLLHPNHSVNARIRKRMYWSILHGVAHGRQNGLVNSDLRYHLALFNTSLAAYVAPPEEQFYFRVLPPHHLSSPAPSTTTSDSVAVRLRASRSAAASVAALPKRSSSEVVVRLLYEGLLDGIKQEKELTQSMHHPSISAYTTMWLQTCVNLLLDGHPPLGPPLFAASDVSRMTDLDFRRSEGILFVRQWCITMDSLCEHLNALRGRSTAGDPPLDPVTWSHMLATVLVTTFLQTSDIPEVEQEMAALMCKHASARMHADGPQLLASSLGELSSRYHLVMNSSLSKWKRWGTKTFQASSTRVLKEYETLSGSFADTSRQITAILSEVSMLSNNPATTPTDIAACASGALDIIEASMRPLAVIWPLSAAGPLYTLWSAIVGLVDDTAGKGKRPPPDLLTVAKRMVESVVGAAPPLFVTRGDTLQKFLSLVSLHNRVLLRSAPYSVTVETLRSLLKYVEIQTKMRLCNSTDAQILMAFFLSTFQLQRDVVAETTVGWSSKRTRNIDAAYSTLLDVLVMLSRTSPALHLGSPIVLRILQETFGFQTLPMVYCIQQCLDLQNGSVPTSKAISERWAQEWSQRAVSDMSGGDIHASRPKTVTAAAFLYLFSGRWKSAPVGTDSAELVQASPSSLFAHCTEEYVRLVKQEAGRTKGVPPKKRHLLPLDGFASRCCTLLLVPRASPQGVHVPVLINPLQPPDDGSLTTAIRLLTSGQQYASVIQLFIACHPFMFMSPEVLLDALISASSVLQQKSATTAASGTAQYLLWLLCTRYQIVELPPAAVIGLVCADDAIAAGLERGLTTCEVDTALKNLAVGATRISRTVSQHLGTAIRCRLLNHLSTVPPVVALDLLQQIPKHQRLALLSRLYSALETSSNESAIVTDDQRLQATRLLSVSLGPQTMKTETERLALMAGRFTWRRAAGLLTHTLGRSTEVSENAQVCNKLVYAVIRSAVAHNSEQRRSSEHRGGTPAKAIWVHGHHRVAKVILKHCEDVAAMHQTVLHPCSERSQEGEEDVVPVDLSMCKTHVHSMLIWLQFLWASQIRDQWSLALPLGRAAQQLAVIAASTMFTDESARGEIHRVAHKAKFASLGYIVDRCDTASRVPIPANVLTTFLTFLIGRPASKLENDADRKRVREAYRVLAKHPRASWADVLELWSLRHVGGAPFPPKLAIYLFENMKVSRRYATILRVASALDMGPQRDEIIEKILTEAATVVAPRAVHDVLLCLRGQLVSKTVDDIISEQEHVQRVESVSFLRRSMLNGNWVAALHTLMEQPLSIMSPRFADACAAVASKGKGFTVLPLVERIVQQSSTISTASAKTLDNNFELHPLVSLLASNAPLLDACLECYSSTCLFSPHEFAVRFSSIASWMLRTRIMTATQPLSGNDVSCQSPEIERHVARRPHHRGDPASDHTLNSAVVQAVLDTIPTPAIPLLEGAVVDHRLGCLEAHSVLWSMFDDLISSCEDMERWMGREENLTHMSRQVKHLFTYHPDIILRLMRFAISFRPGAAVTLSKSLVAIGSSSSHVDVATSTGAFASKYVATRKHLLCAPATTSEMLSQRDVVLFAPTAVTRWLEALAVVAATHDHTRQQADSCVVPVEDGPHEVALPAAQGWTTALVMRRLLHIASQSGSPQVVVGAFRSFEAPQSAKTDLRSRDAQVLCVCVPDYLHALQKVSVGQSPTILSTPPVVSPDDILVVWTESIRRLEMLQVVGPCEPLASNAHLGGVAASLESLTWCLKRHQASENQPSSMFPRHCGVKVSSSGLWSLIMKCIASSSAPAISGSAALKSRLATTLISFAGHLSEYSSVCCGGNPISIRSVDDEKNFWQRSVLRIIQDVATITGNDFVIPCEGRSAHNLTQRQMDSQVHGVLQLLEHTVDIGVENPLDFVKSTLKKIILINPRAMQSVASNDETYVIVKMLCIRVGGADWQSLLEDLLGSGYQRTYGWSSKMNPSSSEDADRASIERALQLQLQYLVKAATSWETALMHISEYVSNNHKLTADPMTAVFNRMLNDGSAARLPGADHEDLSSPPVLENRIALMKAATGLYFHGVSNNTFPTSACIEAIIQLCTKMQSFEDGFEILRSFESFPLPSAAELEQSPEMPPPTYALRDSTQMAITALLETFLELHKQQDSDATAQRNNAVVFVLWFTRYRGHDGLRPEFVAALLKVLGVCSPKRPAQQRSDRSLRAVVNLLSYTSQQPGGNFTLRSVPAQVLTGTMVTLACHSDTATAEISATSLKDVAARLLSCCAAVPDLHSALAVEWAATYTLRRNATRSRTTADGHAALTDALRLYREMIYDSSSLEARALASAIPTVSSGVPGTSSLWMHAMSLVRSFVSHAPPMEPNGETSASLLPSLHNACDALLAEGKWRRALACGQAVANAHASPSVDVYVTGSIASYFAQHYQHEMGRSVVDQIQSTCLGKEVVHSAPTKTNEALMSLIGLALRDTRDVVKQ